jgi:hypothetical protein
MRSAEVLEAQCIEEAASLALETSSASSNSSVASLRGVLGNMTIPVGTLALPTTYFRSHSYHCALQCEHRVSALYSMHYICLYVRNLDRLVTYKHNDSTLPPVHGTWQ